MYFYSRPGVFAHEEVNHRRRDAAGRKKFGQLLCMGLLDKDVMATAMAKSGSMS
jgi:hypothetical protein